MVNGVLAKLIGNYKKTALVLGFLSALAFAPTYAFYLFVASFCLAFKIADNLDSYKKICAFSYWFGFAYFISGFYWIGNALLVDIVSFGWLYPIALFCIGGFFGLFMIPSFAVWQYFKHCSVWSKIFAFACVWVLLEWVRSFIFTGFPWNLLGTAFAFSDTILQMASISGTYGLSFLALIVTGCFYAFLNGRKKSAVAVLCLLISFTVMFGMWRINGYQNTDSDIVVRLVQPSIPQNMKWNRKALEDNFFEYVNLSAQNGLNNVDFVVWGETALPFDIKHNYEYQEVIKKAVPTNGYLLTGVVRFDVTGGVYRPYNSMYVIDDKSNVVNFYDKNHLVPFGEYIPFRKYLPYWIRPIANSVAEFATGEKFKNITLENYQPFGALICYEIIFPDEVINRKNKPEWLVVLTNDGWYGKSSGPYQHLVATRLRAVEEGITIVRSANSGISAVIDPLGRILNQIPLHKKAYSDIKLPEQKTLYTTYANGGKKIFFSAILLILLFLLIQRRVVYYRKYKIPVDTKAI
ncbi:MAG: apolipoprotein N-acyltransferase [Alphaproteobacteria bacterium]|nr:apolipoprotein N-acyltransferase [Alphaproteobacteria bacterium]